MGLREPLGNGSSAKEKRAVVGMQSPVKARTAQGVTGSGKQQARKKNKNTSALEKMGIKYPLTNLEMGEDSQPLE